MARAYLTLEQVKQMPAEDLRAHWQRLYRIQAPALAPDVLRLAIAYRLQAQRHGQLSRTAKSILHSGPSTGDGAPKRDARLLTPGTRLVRDWHGVGQTVTVLENGFDYEGKHWRSLTAIARSITGTHQSGARFFGICRPQK